MVEPLAAAPDLDRRAAVGEGLVERGEDALHLLERAAAAAARARGGGRPSKASNMSSARRPARSAGPPGGEREHAGPGVEAEGADRGGAEVGAILREIVEREAGQPGPLGAQIEIGDGEPMPDRRHPPVERAHRRQRLLARGRCAGAAGAGATREQSAARRARSAISVSSDLLPAVRPLPSNIGPA